MFGDAKVKLSGLMCNGAELAVPLVVDVEVGQNWERAHEICT